MLDIAYVRANPDAVDASCASRQNAHWDREKFFELDELRRSTIVEVEKLQAERNAASKQIGLLMREGKRDEAEEAKAKGDSTTMTACSGSSTLRNWWSVRRAYTSKRPSERSVT